MPRRSRSAPVVTTPATSAPVPRRVPERATSRAKVRSLLALNRTATENLSEVRDALNGAMTDAVQNHHLMKGPFGWIKKLDKMSPEKIRDWVDGFLYYYEVSGIEERANSAPRLPIDEEPEAEAPAAAAEGRSGGTVTPFPAQPH